MLLQLEKDLKRLSSPKKIENSKKFFKMGKGEYGEGDVLLGLSMGEQREFAKDYLKLSLPKIQKLLNSKIHEFRMVAGIILTKKYEKNPEEIFNFYLKNTKRFNNWDLVDVTCGKIVGNFLLNKKRRLLYDLAKSKNLWEKRIAIVSTLEFIKNMEFGDTLKISEILLEDKNDLINRAVGWMLREIGKKDKAILRDFLKINYKKLSRTTLRYAIERFEKEERKTFLKGEF